MQTYDVCPPQYIGCFQNYKRLLPNIKTNEKFMKPYFLKCINFYLYSRRFVLSTTIKKKSSQQSLSTTISLQISKTKHDLELKTCMLLCVIKTESEGGNGEISFTQLKMAAI